MNPTTYLIQNGLRIPINTLNAKASTFGIVAPKEISQTNIVQLLVSDVAAITNIRIALISTGGITFGDEVFGIEARGFIDNNVTPESFFEGVSDKSENSQYNIAIQNFNRFSSQYVYLNINIPIGQEFIAGTVRYQWLFDFA